jgi:dephospho-CoA kinase
VNVGSRAGSLLVVGLTGGIGSGKSVVANRLQALGAGIVDTDELSRELTSPGGDAMPALREAFGADFVTPEGALDRGAMRALAFSDAAARGRLEAILHPAIRERAERALSVAEAPYAVLVVPLLFETRAYASRVDRILVVDCPEAVQVRRTSQRPGLTEADVHAVMAAQWPRWRRLQSADDVIWNGGALAQLEAQCEKMHATYCERALASATIPANARPGR